MQKEITAGMACGREERHFCLDDSPTFQMIELDEADSTNNFLKHYRAAQPGRTILVTAEYQTAGRGSGTNTWESERGRNLLFSLAVSPQNVMANDVFALSEVISLAVCQALNEYREGFTIKWPNDIYFQNTKVVGMLIENDLCGKLVARSVMGVGVNMNQTHFQSDAPNPASLAQILGYEVERRYVLEKVMEHFTHNYRMLQGGRKEDLHREYLSVLYRRGQQHAFVDKEGQFLGTIVDVEATGHLLVIDSEGLQRRYAFKEITYII